MEIRIPKVHYLGLFTVSEFSLRLKKKVEGKRAEKTVMEKVVIIEVGDTRTARSILMSKFLGNLPHRKLQTRAVRIMLKQILY